ncbi:putative bifunctional diguanylate cyclase/phosphodiesterase [Thauera sp.]|uniref:putative bifunctional diguanylate cyclase/phosphodiesterase n=1 Tax=Thauera sp. TaxID=1905334 RepID=UPI002A36C499|nr:EAL domain-containing protein [Thauera sp.]MDX9884476.1 EAL domain-containing protein [Thauera sp.]
MPEPQDSDAAARLRLRAERRLQRLARTVKATSAAPGVLDNERLLHELQVHQIELEMQNEDLRTSRAQVEAALKRYTELYDFSPLAYFTLDRIGTVLQTNLAGAKLLGVERTRLGHTRLGAFLAAQDLPALNAFLDEVFGSRPASARELRLAGDHEPPRFVSIEATLAPDALSCNAVVTDISAAKVANARLQLAASVFSHAREGIVIIDPAGRILDVNAAFTHITGYQRDEVVGRAPSLLNSGRQGAAFYAEMEKTLARDGQWSGEIWRRRKSGEEYLEATTISTVRGVDGHTVNYVALFTDITKVKAQQQQLEHIAHYDPLTNLPNRVLLADRLQHAMIQCQRRGRALAVAYLDLDGFKEVNDRHGHSVGDDLLVTLANRMKLALREGDTLARIGGDEFVAVLVDLAHLQDSTPVLARLLQAASAPVSIAGAALQVSASIGVTIYPEDVSDAEQLLRHADQAMYQAKQAGRNRYHVFDIHQDVEQQSRHENIARIRLALTQQEFVLYYQPKINKRTGGVIGLEALIRWQHPERGLLLPAAFLPTIEGHPLTVEIGEWVVNTALAQMSAWHASGADMAVSVNIDAYQLQKADFVTRLAAMLAAHPELEHRHLELEVLETSALENMGQVSDIMQACHALGVRFALDDFGTGYSSLTYLKHLPADLLKIDQSFVSGMLEDADDRAIVEGVIGLVRAFRREVIAEGVETSAHGELLLKLGCELAQGYGIARPMPAAEVPAWVMHWKQKWAGLPRPILPRSMPLDTPV